MEHRPGGLSAGHPTSRACSFHAPDLARTLQVLARNLDGTPLRYECVVTVKSQASDLQGREGGPSVKSPTRAYVGSNPTPATHNPRSGPVCGPGLTCARERFRGLFTVQLRARSGQVSGLRLAGPRFRGAGIAHRGPLPSDGCSHRSRPCNQYLPGPAVSSCVPLHVAVRGRLADAGRVITGFRGPAVGHVA